MKSKKAKSKTEIQMFKLRCNNQTYEIPADTFSKVSKKCAALVKSNDFQSVINHPVSEEVLNSFICACNLQQFKVALNTAFELLDLSREWGIPTLEAFVMNYIKTKGIQRDETKDCLGPLLEHLEDEDENSEYISNDIANVARHLNKYLDDDRLREVHPEVLFKILNQADPDDYDQQLFVNFVMKLFEDEPEKAVPLTLLMNFDLLTLDQVEQVFQCREMHEQALGYFIAASMSTSRNKMEAENDKIEQTQMNELQDIKDEIKKRRLLSLTKLQKEFAAEKSEIMNVIEQQGKQIAKLKKLKEYQDEKIKDSIESFDKTAAKFDREILRQRTLLRKKRELLADRKVYIIDEYERQSSIIHEEAENVLDDFENRTKSKIEYLQKKVNPPINKIIKKTNDLKDNSLAIHEKLNDANYWVQSNRATLAAKIVHDQVRFNQFLRDLSTRFDAFKTDDKIWELDADQVEEAEKIVVQMEKRITSSCPLNVRQQMQVSVEAFKNMSNLFAGKNYV